MNEGPFRVARPADRRPASHPAPASEQRPQAVPAPSEPARRSVPAPQPGEPRKVSSAKRFLLPFAIILAVIAIVVGGYLYLQRSSSASLIDSSKYQAVFFTNGQVYFGKLQPARGDYLRLTDIYYLQAKSGEQADSANPQETSADSGDVQLIKLGNEIHGPEDQMVISKDQVLFYENLKPDGKVAQSIEKSK